MTVGPVETSTKAESAYVALRDAIRTGVLVPGQRLTLNELAADMGMSLTPIRDALRLLATQGLVEQRTHVGTVVSHFTRERAQDIYRLRLVLEPLAARMAAEAATDADVTDLENLWSRMQSVLDGNELSSFPQLNAAFHNRIYSAADSQYLLEFIDRLWNGVPYQAISLTSRAWQSHAEHRAILNAIADRDGDQAERLTREHITAGETAALDAISG
jgi:DNA-binding GntR family transcriptional regulator